MHLKSAFFIKNSFKLWVDSFSQTWKSVFVNIHVTHRVPFIDIYQVKLKVQTSSFNAVFSLLQACEVSSPGTWLIFTFPPKCRGTFDVHSWMGIRVAVCSDSSEVPTGLQQSLLDRHTGSGLVTHTRLNSHNFPPGAVTTIKTHES